MHAATEVIGMMASLTSFLLWLPQGLRVWRHRHEPARLAGIAMSTQLISVAGNVLWTAYAVLLGSFWLGAPAIVNLPIAVATIVVLRRGPRRRPRGRRTTTPAATRSAPRSTYRRTPRWAWWRTRPRTSTSPPERDAARVRRRAAHATDRRRRPGRMTPRSRRRRRR
ncbi:hypothetical protein [Cellulomonas sp. ATA003]|uniref:hypothetical protein n=1 Tax=Cellulomonas sp. ATA003 TaxID=3073064 RepID=UPI002873CE46|nr:hypothetical protein [Cellulomonas sp. ATA003]WNB85869.1 hypothetical protein REH70_00565 [Cellulomonas sp. ATA003]